MLHRDVSIRLTLNTEKFVFVVLILQQPQPIYRGTKTIKVIFVC